MYKDKTKWLCPHCSQTSSRHWNLKIHIRRKHHRIGEPMYEEEAKEFKARVSNQFFSYNQPHSMNDFSLGSWKREEQERDMIDDHYEIVMKYKEKLKNKGNKKFL
jgi:hypothetical protein